MITPEVARAALAFLGRTELRGNEAPTFLAVVEVLTKIANEGKPNDAAPNSEPGTPPSA